MSTENRRELSATIAHSLRSRVTLDTLSWRRFRELVRDQEGMGDFLPDGHFALDPRNGEVTVFNERRSRRPRDNSPGDGEKTCIICDGRSTPIIDIADLSRGFTFINENLYPIVSPFGETPNLYGAHFLQWTSSIHDADWPQLGSTDRTAVLKRLATLERTLLELPDFPADRENRYVSVIKNVGRLVGGSLRHGHQQIALTNVMPRRTRENLEFRERTGETFSESLSQSNPELTVMELATGRLLVPPYMRRPFDLLYLVQRADAGHLHELDADSLADLGSALATGMKLLESALHSVGRETAYNILFHTGPGAGIYLEFLPLSQENGGFEQLGLSACQASPVQAARQLREQL